MVSHTTTTTQEQALEEQLAHEHGVLLSDPQDHAQAQENDEDVVYLPYAYALEAVVT